MRKGLFIILIFGAALVIIKSFFLPWVTISTDAARVSGKLSSAAEKHFEKVPDLQRYLRKFNVDVDVKESLGDLGKLSGIAAALEGIEMNTTFTGYDIPMTANKELVSSSTSIAGLFVKDLRNIDLKSLTVFLAPILAILCALYALLGLRHGVFVFLMLMIAGAISIGSFYALSLLDLTTETATIEIREGFWYTIYAFFAIFIVGISYLVTGIFCRD